MLAIKLCLSVGSDWEGRDEEAVGTVLVKQTVCIEEEAGQGCNVPTWASLEGDNSVF